MNLKVPGTGLWIIASDVLVILADFFKHTMKYFYYRSSVH